LSHGCSHWIIPTVRTELPSGTVTFLFTDIEGSTRLLHELGAEAYAEAPAEHRSLIRGACTAEDGMEVGRRCARPSSGRTTSSLLRSSSSSRA
jgi:hypothetical protein